MPQEHPEYLKDYKIRPGYIYSDEYDSDYLYIDNLYYTTKENIKRTEFKVYGITHHYVELTKPITTILNNSENMDEFLQELIKYTINTNTPAFITRQDFDRPKFVKEIGCPFVKERISTYNLAYRDLFEKDIKPLFQIQRYGQTETYIFFK